MQKMSIIKRVDSEGEVEETVGHLRIVSPLDLSGLELNDGSILSSSSIAFGGEQDLLTPKNTTYFDLIDSDCATASTRSDETESYQTDSQLLSSEEERIDISSGASSFSDEVSSAYPPFEGVEKRLFIGFRESALRSNPYCSNFMDIEVSKWNELLVPCGCKVLSVCQRDQNMKLLLLSESTLVVKPTQLIIKTCGTTQPLFLIDQILDYLLYNNKQTTTTTSEYDQNIDGTNGCCTSKYGSEYDFKYDGTKALQDYLLFAIYSREDFLFPQQQLFPHQSTTHETEFLSHYFPTHWTKTVPKLDSSAFFTFVGLSAAGSVDWNKELGSWELSELAMRGVDRACSESFASSECSGSQSSVARILSTLNGSATKQFSLDEHWFEPWGYSCNGIFGKDMSNNFVDVHISPEEAVSYASFETSCSVANMMKRRSNDNRSPLNELVACFRPKRLNISVICTSDRAAKLQRIFRSRSVVEEMTVVSNKKEAICEGIAVCRFELTAVDIAP